ncbi:MAG: Lrp/AsnC family transcriptional regulator [Pseudomonadota bacterium]
MQDRSDLEILAALQRDASLTNSALSERVNLSPSQCSRRRIALEQAGVITGYRAEIDAVKMGYTIESYTRVSLASHSESASDEFTRYVAPLPEVVEAQALTGEADYLLRIRVKSLDALADFIHRELLPHKAVSQVRSDIVLKTIKKNTGVQI